MEGNTHLVVTVHGIRTYGQWQSRLKALLQDVEPEISVRNQKYGYFSILAFVFPPTRWLVTRRFRRQLLEVIRSKSWTRIDLIGHSFGTHMLAWALYGIARDKRPEIHTIILSGSVLKSNYRWDDLVGHSVRRMINECGTKDRILLLNQIAVLFTGMAGRIGFNGMTGESFQNRFYQFGHSDYFLKDGKLDDGFMREMWVPLLTSECAAPEVDCRHYPAGLRGALAGIQLWALSNSEPIKLAIWLSPFALALLYVLGLYDNADQQRRIALSRQLAAEAELISARTGRLEESTLLAIESLRVLDAPGTTLERFLQWLGVSRELSVPAYEGAEANAVLRKNLALLPKVALGPEHEERINVVAISPDGTLYATGSADKTAALWTRATLKKPIWLRHDGEVTTVAFSPDGRWFAAATQQGTVQVWDVKGIQGSAKREPKVATMAYPVFDIAFNPDGRTIAACTSDQDKHGMLGIWEYALQAPPIELALKGECDSVAISPDGDLIAVGVSNFGVQVISAKSHREIAALPHPGVVVQVAFGPKGQLAASNWTNTVKLWTPQTGKMVEQFVHEHSVKTLAFSPDGNWLATGVNEMFFPGEVRIWSLVSHREVARMGCSKEIETLTFSPDSRFLASGCQDGSASIWDVPGGHEASRLALDRGAVRGIAFSPDGRAVLSTSGRMAAVWEIDSGGPLLDFDSGHRVNSVRFSSGDGRYLVWNTDEGPTFAWNRMDGGIPSEIPIGAEKIALSRDGPLLAGSAIESGNAIRVWNLATRQEVSLLNDLAPSVPQLWTSVTDIALTPDGKKIAVATATGEVVVNDTVSGTRLMSERFQSYVTRLEFNPEGNNLAVGEDNGNVSIWNMNSEGRLRRMSSFRHRDRISDIAFSADGKLIATGNGWGREGGDHRISDARSGNLFQSTPHTLGVDFVTFSAKGRRFATLVHGIFVEKGEAIVYDVETGAQLSTVDCYSDSIALSPDGEWLAGAGQSGEAVVWRASSGKAVFRQGFSTRVTSLAFSPDAALLAMGSEDGKMYVTPWETDALIDAACERISSNLWCGTWKNYFPTERYRATCPTAPTPDNCQQ